MDTAVTGVASAHVVCPGAKTDRMDARPGRAGGKTRMKAAQNAADSAK